MNKHYFASIVSQSVLTTRNPSHEALPSNNISRTQEKTGDSIKYVLDHSNVKKDTQNDV